MSLYRTIRRNWTQARKARSVEVPAYALIIGELDRLKGKKDVWTNTLQDGKDFADLVVKKVCEGLREMEQEKMDRGVEPDSLLLSVLDREVPLAEQVSESHIVDWIKDNIDFGSLKSPMQAIGMVKREFGDSVDGDRVKQIVSAMVEKR